MKTTTSPLVELVLHPAPTSRCWRGCSRCSIRSEFWPTCRPCLPFSAGDSSQHSLLTWVTWVGANATMAAWLFEHNGRRLNCAIAVSACNSLMCLATSILIVAYRV